MNLTKAESKEIKVRCYRDPSQFCLTFLSHWFSPYPMPALHKGILAILTRQVDWLLDQPREEIDWIIENFVEVRPATGPEDEPSSVPIFSWEGDPHGDSSRLVMRIGRFTLLLIPRGFSKTTLCNAVTIWEICYQERPVYGYISESGTHAQQQLANVTGELTGNAKIRAVFGDLKPEQREGTGKRWAETAGIVETTTGQAIIARGRGAQIRGLNIRGNRPSKLVFDDIEDEESVATEEQRQKTRRWFFGDAIPALPELDPDSTAIVLATLRAAQALPTLLEGDPEWTVVKFGAEHDGTPIWPDMMDLPKIEAKKQSFAAKGMLHVFYLEYFNTVRMPEDAPFKPEYIYVEAVDLLRIPWRSMALDPAISQKRKAAKSAIVVAGMSDDGLVVMLDEWAKHGATPREQVDAYFDLHHKWLPKAQFGGGTFKHGVEAIAYQAALIHLMREEMFRRAKEGWKAKAYFEIEAITHSRTDGSKEERVEGILQPRYSSGYVRHWRKLPQLETQLLDWPAGLRDVIDAAAMAVSLLDEAAASAGGSEIGEDEGPPIEEILGKNWRGKYNKGVYV